MLGLEDSEANTQVGIIVQSLTGLSKLLPFLSSNQYASIFITIAVRIKPFFEKVSVIMQIHCQPGSFYINKYWFLQL